MIKISLKSKSYLGLLFSLLGLMLVMPFMEVGQGPTDRIIVSIFFLLFLLSSLQAISTRGITPRRKYIKWLYRIIALIAFLSNITGVILGILSQRGKLSGGTDLLYDIANVISLFGYSLLILFLIFFIIKDLFSGRKVTVDKIYGAVVSYLLMGVMWACLYAAVNTLNPGAIIKSDGADLTTFSEAQYFSFTTLCTLGYGDIIPTSKLSMVLSNLEAIVGALYLAILVARLVGLYSAQSSQEKINSLLHEIKIRDKEIQDKE